MYMKCNICDKVFIRKYDYDRHINNKYKCHEEIIYICKICDYTTKNKTHYLRHIDRKNKCKEQFVENNNVVVDLLLRQNIKIENLEKQNKKLEKKIKNVNQNNLNFVINNYANALNIEDCINMTNITKEIIDQCRQIDLKDGATLVFNFLCNKSQDMRPIHCTDANRLNYLIKNSDEWSKDIGGEKIKNKMKPVIFNIYDMMHREKVRNMQLNNASQSERLEILDKMCELMTDNLEKSCTHALKKTASDFIINPNNAHSLIEN